MRYIFVYGGLSGAIASGIIVATLAFNLPSHLHSLWFGYLVMLVALVSAALLRNPKLLQATR